MSGECKINPIELILSISGALDLFHPELANHHLKVTYIANAIGTTMGLSPASQQNLVIAATLHDIGSLTLSQEGVNPDTAACSVTNLDESDFHAETGFALLNLFPPFSQAANIVKFHHVPWEFGKGSRHNEVEVPIESHILHLADRIAVKTGNNAGILKWAEYIKFRLKTKIDEQFNPEIFEAFEELSKKEYFWLDTNSSDIKSIIKSRLQFKSLEMDEKNLLGIGKLFSQIVDFRSSFTATHSAGVAAVSESLAKFVGFSSRDQLRMHIAGYFHDLGKLAIPSYILEKQSKLAESEIFSLRSHSYYTFRILENVKGFETINSWASLHHERLDGSGYPFRFKGKNIPQGARILAVADIFTACTEDRPYRLGLPIDKVYKILKHMVGNNFIDGDIVETLSQNFDEVNKVREEAQQLAAKVYRTFKETLPN
jgi:HD-GYP domain-containing protein (c-di-GMP phosphodiesterase class II)